MGAVAGATLAGGAVWGSTRNSQCSCSREIVAGEANDCSPSDPHVVSAVPAAQPLRLSNFSARRLLWISLEAEGCFEHACAKLNVTDRLDSQKLMFGVPRLGRVALPSEIAHRHSGTSRPRAWQSRGRAVCGSKLKL